MEAPSPWLRNDASTASRVPCMVRSRATSSSRMMRVKVRTPARGTGDEALDVLDAAANDLGVFGVGAELEVGLEVCEGGLVVLKLEVDLAAVSDFIEVPGGYVKEHLGEGEDLVVVSAGGVDALEVVEHAGDDLGVGAGGEVVVTEGHEAAAGEAEPLGEVLFFQDHAAVEGVDEERAFGGLVLDDEVAGKLTPLTLRPACRATSI